MDHITESIRRGTTSLGMELGTTRAKAVLIDKDRRILASGSCRWESRLESGLWVCRVEEAISAMQKAFRALADEVRLRYGVPLTRIGRMGVSAMTPGHLVLDRDGTLLSPFYTWKNSNTAQAAAVLTEEFDFRIPLRWGVAHLYQAVLEGREYLPRIHAVTTLSGYLHSRLCGEHCLGLGDASELFPMDPKTLHYDATMVEKFRRLTEKSLLSRDILELLPRPLAAGTVAGRLTEAGARLLDPTGSLESGTLMAPPEADASTGLVATNAVAPGTGTVSAGTSVFAMTVLDQPLSACRKTIDSALTPSGHPVTLVQSYNGTTELDTWLHLFRQVLDAAGAAPQDIYGLLLPKALEADFEAGGVLAFNWLSGEPHAGSEQGLPMLLRPADGTLTLENFMKAHLCGMFTVLTMGIEKLQAENLHLTRLSAHGGIFKTPGVAQRFLAASMGIPVTIPESAGEGGAFGMALLADFLESAGKTSLEDYVSSAFRQIPGTTVVPTADEISDFAAILRRYRAAIPAEITAARCTPPLRSGQAVVK